MIDTNSIPDRELERWIEWVLASVAYYEARAEEE